MIQLAVAILDLNQDRLLQCDAGNIMLTLTREVVGATLQNPDTFRRLMELLNTRFSADGMLPLAWQ